jgi:hypothetical protein
MSDNIDLHQVQRFDQLIYGTTHSIMHGLLKSVSVYAMHNIFL